MTEVVAELSGNHGGVLKNALILITEAKKAGADAVKFQCFDPVRLALARCLDPDVIRELANIKEDPVDGRKKAPTTEERLLALYKKIWTPRSWFPALISKARSQKINWFSSVFDPEDVTYLETLDCPRYKISAFDMLNHNLIRAVKRTGKPIIMSVRSTEHVMVLHASAYNGTFGDMGLSWHTDKAPAVRMSHVPMIEFHLRLESVDTPDKDFSLTGEELSKAVLTLKGNNDVSSRRGARVDAKAG